MTQKYSGASVGGMRDALDHWDRTFSEIGQNPESEEPWLGRWIADVLEAGRDAPVLDLGCGSGLDSQFLIKNGFDVISADFSKEALEATRRRVPEARLVRFDMTHRLPFPDASFRVVVASLSLHYFPWQTTLEILGEVRRTLKPGGYLLARFNSTRDVYYSAAAKEEVEKNFYLVGGLPKRLFDRRSVEALFAGGWEIDSAEERATRRYGGEKTVWEVAARKTD